VITQITTLKELH